MTEQLAELTDESDLLRKRHDQARLELQEATTKLSVLTQYLYCIVLLTEQLAELTDESDLLRKRHDQARLELQEATTKLSVLTQYLYFIVDRATC